jgi:hypothetical protein
MAKIVGIVALFAAGLALAGGLAASGVANVTTTSARSPRRSRDDHRAGRRSSTLEQTTTRRVVVPTSTGTTSGSSSTSDTPTWVRVVLGPSPLLGMLDGRHGHNAWLHELPDPVTKVTWDNYASFSPAAAKRLGVADGDVVRVTATGAPPLELPALDGQRADQRPAAR